MTDAAPESQDPFAECERSRFLSRLLNDEERGRLGSLDQYLAEYPGISDFVRSEYEALDRSAGSGAEPGHGHPAAVGRYLIRSRLGAGGMGTVYEAMDPQLNRRVVVKSLHPALVHDAAARDRLRREARVLGSLDHGGLVKVIDVVEQDGVLHLVMPFHEGRTLAALIATARGASASVAGGVAHLQLPGAADRGSALRAFVGYLRATALALDHAHQGGVIHRDLKPENLLVLADGTPLVLDFGLSQPSGELRLTAQGEIVGTPLYMAPEQIEGQLATPATDVYALGVILYEGLALVHPHAGPGGRDGAFRRILRGDPVPLRRHQPLISRDLEAVVLRAMDPAPTRRYPSAGALARELQRVLDLEPTEARPISAITAALRRIRRRPQKLLIGAGFLLAAASTAWTLLQAQGLRRQQDRVRDELIALQAQPQAGPVRAELGRVLERMRSLPFEPGPSMHAIHPRGAVVATTTATWIGLAAVDDDLMPGQVFVHRYRVEVRDGSDAVVATVEHDADPASRWCTAAIPELAGLTRGRWLASWIGARGPDGVFVAATAAESAATAVSAVFSTAPGPLPDGAPACLAAGFASAALLAALQPNAGNGERSDLSLALAAAKALEDGQLVERLAVERAKEVGR